MTEKEFENLKVGDKVWIITDWVSTIGEGMKALQMEVAGKEEDKHNIQCIGCSLVSDHCYLTKAEAWEAEVKECEKAVKAEEEYLSKKQATLTALKSELAKAKEEEVWTVDFDKGTVVRSTKRRWEGSAENYEWSLGSPRYKPCDTEREAYEALAKFYLEKYYETRRKVEEKK